MKKNYTLLFIMLLCAVFVQAQTTPAFPGAEGFARYTVPADVEVSYIMSQILMTAAKDHYVQELR